MVQSTSISLELCNLNPFNCWFLTEYITLVLFSAFKDGKPIGDKVCSVYFCAPMCVIYSYIHIISILKYVLYI